MRVDPAAPAPPQPAPPEETAPEAEPSTLMSPPGRAAGAPGEWRPTTVPGVFDARALAPLFAGSVRRYRTSFTGPATPRGFSWRIRFESVRRAATVFLNGRRIGRSIDPYTPFEVDARGLRPGRPNQLVVVVDSRKDPKLPEGWWNWGGIVRPVRLVPVGRANIRDLGTMSRVRCRRPARACRAEFLVDGVLERLGRRPVAPRLEVRLRSPRGRTTTRTFRIDRLTGARRRVTLAMRVPAPMLWSPDRPRLYSARLTLRERGSVQQVDTRRIGLRSVEVKRGRLYLNNRRVQLRGASLHEDMPGHGAALTGTDMDEMVQDLEDLGANVTRAHYLMSEGMLDRLDRAGILVWSQAPIWQRDHGANLLWRPKERRKALATVARTVKAARSHPSVLTHSVANELSFSPDFKPGTRIFLDLARELAGDLDPTVPISVDTKGRPGYGEQFTYKRFELLGVNQYFGWYRWVENFDDLEPFINEQRDHYERNAIVMTEWGAEARPELAAAPASLKGSYGFQSFHAQRTLDVIDRSQVLSGAIYWTIREFEIYPGWSGGAGPRPPQYRPNTRHHKGLIGYDGERKPAFFLVRDRYRRTPLFP
jgi:beta-galactosidase/beta-glucuronidase